MDTDYVDYVKDYNESDTSSLKMLLKKKLADEVTQVQAVAGPDLENFLEMIRHKYMIDNVINIIEGAKNKTATAIIKYKKIKSINKKNQKKKKKKQKKILFY